MRDRDHIPLIQVLETGPFVIITNLEQAGTQNILGTARYKNVREIYYILISLGSHKLGYNIPKNPYLPNRGD